MPKPTITDEMKQQMRVLYIKGYLPCEEIAGRLGVSKQSVAVSLRKMGVDMSKRRFIVPCTTCQCPVEKTRGEVRQYMHHFCGTECYREWLRNPEVQIEQQRIRMLLEAANRSGVDVGYNGEGVRIHDAGDDVWVFPSREAMLEWMRTGLTAAVFSVRTQKDITAPPFGTYSKKI